MISFFICLFLLIGGYFVYGKVVENTFAPDDRETPAVKINDGVDYVVMPQWKLFLVQLLNIAGLGPIFGAMQGALWGPVVFLWITFGTIFAGGVHDYFSGMLSERNDGASISEVCGIYLGGFMKNVMRVFSVVLLVMVGTVFAVGPAGLIVTLFKNGNVSGIVTSTEFWLWIILAYYFIATFISIDKIIGRIYPLFGICLIIMALGVALGIFTHSQYQIPEIWSHFTNMHPKATPIWSVMFITVACGAISGFHATQSPLMARCMKSEKQGHFVFYGAMVAEGIIALIWAAAGCSIYEVTDGLSTGLSAILANGQSAAIYDVCSKTMGGVGVALAMIGVIVCPITSGDTAFRSARLVLADWFKIDQGKYSKRLMLCVPLLAVGAFVGHLDYTIIWRYFSWTNQTLAMIVLWTASMFLFKEKKNYWITAVPATFMSAVSMTYFFYAKECLNLGTKVAYPAGIIIARDNIVSGIDNIFNGFSSIDDDFYEELEETLIMGDIGVRATDEIIEDLKAKVKENKIKDPKDCKQLLIDTIKEKMNLGPNAYEFENTKSIVMLIGVNGVGKTTSVGKLAGHLKEQNKKVVLAAADTFRAAAIEQLTEWANRVGADIIAQNEGSDPAAVIYDSIAAAKARHADVLLCDTAGRLQNKKNLMEELRKIDRVIEREYADAYRENLIVLDATTGQNALSQLREFNDVTNITGIILTKMDGTAKGGIAVAIQAEFGIPVKYIGVGEQVKDLQKFDSDTFVNALFDTSDNEDDDD